MEYLTVPQGQGYHLVDRRACCDTTHSEVTLAEQAVDGHGTLWPRKCCGLENVVQISKPAYGSLQQEDTAVLHVMPK